MPTSKRLTPASRKELAALVRATRKALRLNQTEFGRLLGIGQRGISNWELGKSLDTLNTGMLFQRLVDQQQAIDPTARRLRELNAQLDALLESK